MEPTQDLAFQQIKTAAHPRLTEPSVELTIRLNGESADAVRKAMVSRSEIEIAGIADTTLVVSVPESGDEVQTLKSGIMEIVFSSTDE